MKVNPIIVSYSNNSEILYHVSVFETLKPMNLEICGIMCV